MTNQHILLCPGQGAQAVGMGKTWCDASPAAAALFAQADHLVELDGGARLSALCFEGPTEHLNRTDVSQPALFTCGLACHAAMVEQAAKCPSWARLDCRLASTQRWRWPACSPLPRAFDWSPRAVA